MSLHSAKGLEFPVVFLAGMEQGLFPHQRSMEDPVKMEEERRLCYVGMTRAKRVLTMSHAQCRRLHGKDFYPMQSRFIREIPEKLIRQVRLKGSGSLPGQRETAPPPRFSTTAATRLRSEQEIPFKPGQRVAHPKFGEGVVLMYEGDGGHTRIQVNFSRAGSKWLMVAQAPLQAV